MSRIFLPMCECCTQKLLLSACSFLGLTFKPWVAPRAPDPHPEVVGFLLVLGVLVLDVCSNCVSTLIGNLWPSLARPPQHSVSCRLCQFCSL